MSDPIQRLIHEFSRLPGVGEKTASRFVFHLLARPTAEANALADAIADLKLKIRPCSVCFNLTEEDPCRICSDQRRMRETICVVEDVLDLLAIERTGAYRGMYHVLGGVLSPMHGINPDDLKIEELLGRVRQQGVTEVILATNPKVEGEATAVHLSGLLKPLGVRISRLAYGIPMGADLEYTNVRTILKALENRTDIP